MTRSRRSPQAPPPRAPVSTYRLQLGPELGFSQVAALLGYLDLLGITDVYLSPALAAATGSTHGYDVVDPTRLNPALGTEEDFAALALAAGEKGMGLVLDIVPSHMAASPENPWWSDVLMNGRSSRFASFFDIDWDAPYQEARIVLPVLADRYAAVLERGEISIRAEAGMICARYRGLSFPLEPVSIAPLLSHAAGRLAEALGPRHGDARELGEIASLAASLPPHSSRSASQQRRRQAKTAGLAERLEALCSSSPEAAGAIEDTLALVNEPEGGELDLIDGLLRAQPYRLCFTPYGAGEINYRRFAAEPGLVRLNTARREVFEASHELVVGLVESGQVSGLRVDHIDGMSDPAGYLARLRGELPVFLMVEKILAQGEELPAGWPVEGTTGYDFLNLAGDLFVDPEGLAELEAVYARFTGSAARYCDHAGASKRQVISDLFPAEFDELARGLHALARDELDAADLPLALLRQALVELTVALPVYRTYIREVDASARDQKILLAARDEASGMLAPGARPALDFVCSVLCVQRPEAHLDEALSISMRWQQLTPGVAAKGLEDTAFFRHHALISRNEVGADPAAPVLGVGAFHLAMAERARRQPLSLSATSTHDSKRSEDVRSRLAVLSEVPEMWEAQLRAWADINRASKQPVEGRLVPSPAEEVMIYQTLLGLWPPSGARARLVARVRDHAVKAIREAKLNSHWLVPSPSYEQAAARFVSSILEPSNAAFLEGLEELAEILSGNGALNSLAQVLIKAAAPGIPDLYQGNESWDLSLTDPDNRRPADPSSRSKVLAGLLRRAQGGDRAALVAELASSWRDGRLKLYVTAAALRLRRERADLFSKGSYVPVQAEGEFGEHIVSFARRLDGDWAMVAVPRLAAGLAGRVRRGRAGGLWGRTRILLPEGAPARWSNVLTGEEAAPARRQRQQPSLAMDEVFGSFPLALLVPA